MPVRGRDRQCDFESPQNDVLKTRSTRDKEGELQMEEVYTESDLVFINMVLAVA